MSYAYVKHTYPVNPVVGQRVTHRETGESGTITREDRSQSHYVMVRFGEKSHSLPCHPTSLEYGERP